MADREAKVFDNVRLTGGVGGAMEVGSSEDTGRLVVRGSDLEFNGERASFSMPGVRRLFMTSLGHLAVEFADPPAERHFVTGRGLGVRSATKRLLADLEAAMRLSPVEMAESEVRDLADRGRRQIRLAPLAVPAAALAAFALTFAFRFLWRGIFASEWDAGDAWDFAFGFGVVGIGVGLMAAFLMVAEGRAKLRRSEGR